MEKLTQDVVLLMVLVGALLVGKYGTGLVYMAMGKKVKW
jgi:hypothetical protein